VWVAIQVFCRKILGGIFVQQLFHLSHTSDVANVEKGYAVGNANFMTPSHFHNLRDIIPRHNRVQCNVFMQLSCNYHATSLSHDKLMLYTDYSIKQLVPITQMEAREILATDHELSFVNSGTARHLPSSSPAACRPAK